MNLLFFGGRSTPLKRYQSYFKFYKLVTITDWNHDCDNLIILTHSLGILQCLVWCHQNQIQPKLIISMDGVSLCHPIPVISLDGTISPIYNIYQQSGINPKNYKIHVFRPANKLNYGDENIYQQITYYNLNTHYPYTNQVRQSYGVMGHFRQFH